MNTDNLLPFKTAIIRMPYFEWRQFEQIKQTDDLVTKLLTNAVFMEAIMIASPALYNQSMRLLHNELDEKKKARVILSLFKYYIRMTTRCTPFGKFAGCSVVKFGEQTAISRIHEKSFYKSKIRLDALCSVRLAKKILHNPELRKQLRFKANTSLKLINEHFQYIEHRNENGKFRYYNVSVENSLFLTEVIKLSCEYCSYHNLLTKLISLGLDKEDASSFLDELINEQILLSEIELNLTGINHLDNILAFLKNVINNENTDIEFCKLYEDVSGIFKLMHKYEEADCEKQRIDILQTLQKQLTEQNLIDADEPFVQADAYFELQQSTINEKTIDDVKEAYHVLSKIFFDDYDDYFKAFKEKFVKRYDERAVSVINCLDVETGIGYKEADAHDDIAPLVDDIVTNGSRRYKFEKADWTAFDSMILSKYIGHIKNNVQQIELSDEDVEPLHLGQYPMADTFSAIFSIVNDRGNDKVLLNTVSGSSATNLLGRFAHLHSEINALITTIQNFEKHINPDKLITEIIHNPAEIRHSNILVRNRNYEYETPYLGNSLLPEDKRIETSDMMLQYLKQENRLILFSKKHRKEILPRLGTAHNFTSRNLSLYSFLCDMQYNGKKRFMSFSWETMRKELSFRPRVSYKNIILSLASWNLDNYQIRDCENTYKNRKNIDEWIASHKIPRRFSYVKNDNRLLIDIDIPLSLVLFLNEIKSEERVILEEYIEPSKSIGSANEIIISFANPPRKQSQKTPKISCYGDTPANTSYHIGTEWLYFKVYCGIASSDEIINEAIFPLIETNLSDGFINSFFFIRYNEGGYHIRLRLHKSDKFDFNVFIKAFNAVLQPYRNTGQVSNVEMDTYSREIERYGGNELMNLSEQLFFHNSLAIIKMQRVVNIHPIGVNLRWLTSIRMITVFLDALNIPMANRLIIFEHLRNAFYSEFNGTKETKEILDQKFRTYKNEINNIINNNFEGELNECNSYIDEYKNSLSDYILPIYQLIKTSDITIEDFIINHIHMHINRSFISKQRKHELAIYDILARYYKSLINRNNEKKNH